MLSFQISWSRKVIVIKFGQQVAKEETANFGIICQGIKKSLSWNRFTLKEQLNTISTNAALTKFEQLVALKGTLMQFWKPANILVFIWK